MGRDLSHTLHLYQRVLTQPPRDRYLAMRELGKQDLFFLLVVLCKRRDIARQWLLDRCDEVRARPDGMLDLWAREHYKDLADSTPMLTANRGWTMHGELAVGDAVFSPSGKPVRVLALSERYSDSECYRVTFHDGASLVAGAGHLWRLRSKMRRRIANSELRRIEWGERVVRTVDLVQSTRGDVGVTEPIEFPVRQLPLHPYVLGQWLGDGHSTNGRITSGDDEVFDRIERLGYRLSSSSKPITRNVYGIMPVLRSIGVLGAKRIPHDYMTASVHQRMELLRGLMDSDGHCNTRGTATFVNTNDDLAEDVRELAAGLGLRPRKRFYKSKVGADFWQVSFQAHKDRNPFWLQRKASRAIDSGGWRETRNVMSVERVTSVPTRCIQVEGGMYLAGLELVPTHNSSIITYGLTIQSVLRDPETTVGIFSHTRPIAKGFLVQIKRELESNVELQRLYPEILWVDPAKESPRWSEDGGLVVKRLGNPKEATIEAYGLVDGQPVGKHYKVMVFDDIVTRENAASPEMRRKTLEGLSLAQALGTDGGVKRYVGTRYHYADAYADIVDRGTARPRVYPAEVDGRPVLLSAERMADLRRDMVAYVFCFPAGTPVLMADWSEKPIEQIVAGDMVLGYDLNRPKAKLVATEVKALCTNQREVMEATFESGRTVRCTPDHKWFTGRRGTDGHLPYAKLYRGDAEKTWRATKYLLSVYDPRKFNHCQSERAASWLAGIFDGEGSCSAGTIFFAQSIDHNPDVVQAIKDALDLLGFEYSIDIRVASKSTKNMASIWLRGGRQALMRFLNICNPVRRRKIELALLKHGCKILEGSYRDNIVSSRDLGEQQVFNIETGTGNYIAWGYATKNSAQMMLDPKGDESVGFRSEWRRIYEGEVTGNTYAVADPANSKKKDSDYTAIWIVTAGEDGNFYVRDLVYRRMSLDERVACYIDLHRKWRPLAFGIEQYGMMADTTALRMEQKRLGYRFEVVELGGKLSKPERISRLEPLYRQGKVYEPPTIRRDMGSEGMIDVLGRWRRDEYEAWPYSGHDDGLDALSRICDMRVMWPASVGRREAQRDAVVADPLAA